jgi:hypothetical protein
MMMIEMMRIAVVVVFFVAFTCALFFIFILMSKEDG